VDDSCLGDEWTSATEDQRDRALALASSTLRRLTGYRVGGCPVKVRPCSRRASCAIPVYSVNPGTEWMRPGITAQGYWVNGCGCTSACSCTTACEVSLPAPIGQVFSVVANGVEMDLSDFRIDDGHLLVYTGGGECPFNLAQDLSLDDSQPGTFSVTYLNAYPVDSLGATAAGLLALEFLRACKPKAKCALPRGVTDVVRNGVSFTIQAGLFPDGLTNIDLVDGFIELWNPKHLLAAASVWTPGGSKVRTSRGTGGNTPLDPILDGGGP
jgi:hypothetical protein